MSSRVREPIQVYLSAEERAALDDAAAQLGVSRSEVLRRGVEALSRRGEARGSLADLARQGAVVPPSDLTGTPPPSLPVAPLRELLDELDQDRGGR